MSSNQMHRKNDVLSRRREERERGKNTLMVNMRMMYSMHRVKLRQEEEVTRPMMMRKTTRVREKGGKKIKRRRGRKRRERNCRMTIRKYVKKEYL